MRAPDPLPPTVARDLEAMDAAVARRPYDDGDPHLVELAPALGLAACALLALVVGLATRGGGPGTSAGGGSTAAGGGGGVSAAGRAAPERLSGGSASTVTPRPRPRPPAA